MNHSRKPTARPHDPFDDSAIERHKRMGLLNSHGQISINTMEVFCHLYAGLFYDDVCDHCEDYAAAASIFQSLIAVSRTDEVRRVLLAISVQYDAMRRSLPEPIWWIAGNPTLVSAFIEGFTRRLSLLIRTESEVI